MRAPARDVLLHVRHARDLRAAADLDVPDDARVSPHHDEVAKLRRAGDARLCDDDAMAPDTALWPI